jgi:ribokinase
MTPELVLLGNLLVDDLVFPDGRTRMGQAGGAMLYGSLGAALWNARVGCVSLRGEDYPAAALEHLRRRGVALDGVASLNGPGVRTWLLYEGGLRRVVHRLGGPTHAAVSPETCNVPEAWRDARAFHLAPMPIEVQARLAEGLGGGEAFISIDPYELVTEASLPRWLEVLRHADAFFPSEDDLLLEGAASDPHATLRRLAGGRLRYVAWKRGPGGGILWDAREDRFHEWDARTNGVVDPTGAGDCFAAGFLVAQLEGCGIMECVHRGVVTASFAIEAWGPEGLLEATRADAQARLKAWYGEEVAR